MSTVMTRGSVQSGEHSYSLIRLGSMFVLQRHSERSPRPPYRWDRPKQTLLHCCRVKFPAFRDVKMTSSLRPPPLLLSSRQAA